MSNLTINPVGFKGKKNFDYENKKSLYVKNFSLPDKQSLALPTVANLKANFISFKGDAKEVDAQFSVTEDTGVKLADVGGLDSIREIIEKRILGYIKNPDKFNEQGAKIAKGILLYGPPGTGKTYLAKAIAGEAGVPFISTTGSDFVNTYVGVGAKNVRKLFDFAREEARKTIKVTTIEDTWNAATEEKRRAELAKAKSSMPFNTDYDNLKLAKEQYFKTVPKIKPKTPTAIIFIDEFDALATSRDDGGRNGGRGGAGQESKQTVNALLAEMDGMKNAENKDVNIIVLAATNYLDSIDEAVKREGRFDYKLEVPNPSRNTEARKSILEIHSRNKKFENAREKERLLKEASKITKGFSGATIAEFLNRAATYVALRDDKKFITENDLIEARLEILAGPKNKSDSPKWAKENTVAHECAHALIGQVLFDTAQNPWERPYENSIITTDERGDYLGAVFTNEGENPVTSFNSLIANTARSYGGYFAEKERNGSNFSGVSSDLENATNYVTSAVTRLGLGPNTKIIAPAANKFAENATRQETEKDIKLITDSASKVAKLIIDYHKGFITDYVNNYKDNAGKGGNNLSGEEFAKILTKWQKDPSRQESYKNLQKNVREIIEKTKNDTGSKV
ncbi:MAG: AAA family ATPase [Candidatus Gastranaerophilaceae bacterium]|jgi:ATP-dependent Zn protease